MGTEHVLLALFAQPEAIATKILAAHGIARDRVLAEIPSDAHPPLSKLVSSALTEAIDRVTQALTSLHS